jgi:hypothetical protein
MPIQIKHSASYLIIIPIIIIFAFAFLAFFSDSVLGQTSADAIAIRVLPNNDYHYSALRWYKEKKFTGSPQSMLVDGYEAVRDGRTVYVNAANITAGNSGDVLYTNIYIISYNQEAENKTQDIFGQILAHWQFNSNMTVNITDIGQCSGKDNRNCWEDDECPLGELCNSRKARIVRDTRRLADLAEIKIALNDYKTLKGKYPVLASGSYLPNKTLSVWPSWQKVLAQELTTVPLPIDPENKLGACPGFNDITCWDEINKSFYDPVDNDMLDLPAGSNVYAYSGSNTGTSYNVCAVMESDLVEGAGSGNCATDGNIGISEESNNNPPVFVSSNLDGYQNRLYEGFIVATDPDGDNLTWTFTPLGTWTNWVNPPANVPALVNISPYQKILRADRAGDVGTYSFRLTINDGRGGITQEDFTIKIESPLILGLVMPNMTYYASTTNPINYRYTVSDQVTSHTLTGNLLSGWTGSMAGSQFSITGPLNTTPGISVSTSINYNLEIVNDLGDRRRGSFNIRVINNAPRITAADASVIVGQPLSATNITATDDENNNFTITLNGSLPVGLNRSPGSGNVQITGTPSAQAPLLENPYDLTIVARDVFGAESSQPFTITVINHPPIMNNINCANRVRVNSNFSCTVSAADITDNHSIARYQMTNQTYPPGLTINPATGVISGIPRNPGNYRIEVSAVDQFGAVSNNAYIPLLIVNYCGDGARQSPNTEGQGGPANNGMEDCDGTSGIATSPSGSSQSLQYGCSPACIATGGWCGDGVRNGTEICDRTDGLGPNQSCSDTCTLINLPYCGDGVRNGTEICEGTEGIATSPSGSSPTLQYSCTPPPAGCTPTGGWCGDGIVQDGTNSTINAGENCDIANSCCNRCQLTCPPYISNNITFGTGQTSTVSLSEVNSATTINFPTCRLFDNTSASLNAQLGLIYQPSGIIFVTDTSNSMGNNLEIDGVTKRRMVWVNEALANVLGNLYNRANQQAPDSIVNVGMVDFDNRVNPEDIFSIVDIKNFTNYQALLTEVSGYSYNDTAAGTLMGHALYEAYNMLIGTSYTNKVIILLSDGAPGDPGWVRDWTANAKAAGMAIYTLTFRALGTGSSDTCDMCGWSSQNNNCGTHPLADCLSGPYAYQSIYLDTVYNQMANHIFPSLPPTMSITLNSVITNFSPALGSNLINLNPLTNINCTAGTQQFNMSISPLHESEAVLSNFTFQYCPLCQ